MVTKKSGGGKKTPNYRNSETGRYTTKKKAERSPKTHEKERRK